MKEVISTNNAPAAVGPYSQAVKSGNLLFCSDQISLDPASGVLKGSDIKAQTEQVMQNISAVLAASGATLDDVVKTTSLRVFPEHKSHTPCGWNRQAEADFSF